MNKIKTFFSGLFKNVWFGIKTCFLASKFYFSMKLIILMVHNADTACESMAVERGSQWNCRFSK